MSDKRSRHDSDGRSQRSRRTSYHTRSEAGVSTASSTLSEVRRRAALSKLQAEQGQRAAAAKTELAQHQAEAEAEQARHQAEQARHQAEAEAERARRQAEAEAEQARWQAAAKAEQARQQAALEAQQLKDEAERDQLELQLIEEEENGLLPSGDVVSPVRLPAAAPIEPPGPLRELRPDDAAARTRDWLDQSLRQTRPAGVTSLNVGQAPENRNQRETVRQQTAPHLPRIILEKFGGSALEWPRWVALFKALVHNRADLTDVERLTYLQAYLTGPAKEAVRGMLCDASLYGAALRDLEKEFGDPSRVVQATMKKLLTARPVRDGELSALTELSRDLHTAVSVLQCLKYESDLAALTNVTAVTGKLPANLAWKWGEHVIERETSHVPPSSTSTGGYNGTSLPAWWP